MRKLALSDEILLSIEKPERYIGNEVNSIMKEKENVAIRFAMCFPDVYEIGMSHLGIQILYDMFNRREDVWCERVYSPWPDMDHVLRESKIPLFALESQDPIKDFDFLGITIQYEMCYTNILQVIDLSHIPLIAKERGESDPIVIGGGPCAYNPEPIADFFDLFYIGEGETQYHQLLDLYRNNKENGGSREDFLKMASAIPGIYVPKFYDIVYQEDGTILQRNKNYAEAPDSIKRELVVDLTNSVYPEKPVVPFIRATQDRVVMEIQRGCIRGCRFCQAGMLYRPLRERNVKEVEKLAVTMLKNTGHEEISLSSLSTSDYSELPELIDYLVQECSKRYVNISLPSLRIDAFSLEVMNKVQDIKKSSLTFAPEAGSQRMRDVINKGLTEDIILEGAGMAFQGGWDKVKLYFMLGLPTETEEDIKEIAILSDKIARHYYALIPKENRHGKVQIIASTSFFIPKPFTPFQWAPMNTAKQFEDKAHLLNDTFKEQLNHKSIRYNWHESDVSELEGFFARGDRRCAKVLLAAYKKGCIFDAWSDLFRGKEWIEAFRETNTDMSFYTTRERDLEEVLPWDFIDIGVTKDFMKREWEQARKEIVTPNCRMKCSGCGASAFKGGVCIEAKN